MFTEIRIYYEGNRLLKSGFHVFLRDLRGRAEKKQCKFVLVEGGSRAETCKNFGLALRTHRNAWNILLIDSEGPHTASASLSLCQHWEWNKSQADSIFWMVEMMESWFHADKDALKNFYGPEFNENALRANPRVEEIPKEDLKEGLRAATKNTGKGDYFENKTLHGPALLAKIRPELVQTAAPNCNKLFTAVRAKLSQRLIDIPE